MNTFKISIHPTAWEGKPKTATEKASLARDFNPTELNLEGLAQYINNGHTVSPSLLKDGYRNAKNFISSQVIMLDYDDNQSVEDEINKLKEINLNPNLVYNSFSHKPSFNKFRLVIVLDTTTITITPASNKDTLEELQTAKLNNENNEELTITKTIDMPTEYAKKSTVKGTTEYIEKVADGSTKREQDYAFKRESPKSVYDREVVANTYVETFTDEMYQSAVDRKLYPHQVVDAINAKAGNNSLIDYSTFKLEKT